VADAAVMTWGGLRGAVGLALAIQVYNDRAPDEIRGIPQISQQQAEVVIFFVSGIAFLTTIINATTAPALVNRLNITATPHARQQLVMMFHQQLVRWSQDSSNPKEVTDSLKSMLQEAEHHISEQQIQASGPASGRSAGRSEFQATRTSTVALQKIDGQSSENVIQNLHHHEARFQGFAKAPQFATELPENLLGNVDDLVDLVSKNWVDEGMAKVVNSCFLNLVNHNYWKLIDRGDLRPGSVESEILFTSIRVSLSPYRVDLVDYNFVRYQIDRADDNEGGLLGAEEAVVEVDTVDSDSVSDRNLQSAPPPPTGLGKFVASVHFNVFIAIAILLNSVQVAVEEAARNDSNDQDAIWLVLDSIFTIIFTLEFVCKFLHLRCGYFKDNWNRFDFVLVVLGIFGLAMTIVLRGANSEVSGHARIIRVARVLRTMRFLRVFRLFHAKLGADKFISVDLAKHMKKINTLQCFVHAHLGAQNDLIKFFGGNGKLDEKNEAEIARCILQSQTSVYQAMVDVAKSQRRLGKTMTNEMLNIFKRKNITEGLERFVLDAHRNGALSAKEAEQILHPLHHQIAYCMSVIHQRAEGLIDKRTHADWKIGQNYLGEASTKMLGRLTQVAGFKKRKAEVCHYDDAELNGTEAPAELDCSPTDSNGGPMPNLSSVNLNAPAAHVHDPNDPPPPPLVMQCEEPPLSDAPIL